MSSPGAIKMRDLRLLEGYVKELDTMTAIFPVSRDISLLVRKLTDLTDRLIRDAEVRTE